MSQQSGFNWKQYYFLAQELLTKLGQFSTGNEAVLRSIISRAYYASFKVCHNYLRDFESVAIPFDGNVHWFVINEFKNKSDDKEKDVCFRLERLRKLRNLADYQDILFDPVYRATQALNISNKILQEIETLKTNH